MFPQTCRRGHPLAPRSALCPPLASVAGLLAMSGDLCPPRLEDGSAGTAVLGRSSCPGILAPTLPTALCRNREGRSDAAGAAESPDGCCWSDGGPVRRCWSGGESGRTLLGAARSSDGCGWSGGESDGRCWCGGRLAGCCWCGGEDGRTVLRPQGVQTSATGAAGSSAWALQERWGVRPAAAAATPRCRRGGGGGRAR